MTITVDIKKDYVLSILEGLEKIGALNIKQADQQTSRKKNKTYEAVRINLSGYHFNREEANDR